MSVSSLLRFSFHALTCVESSDPLLRDGKGSSPNGRQRNGSEALPRFVLLPSRVEPMSIRLKLHFRSFAA